MSVKQWWANLFPRSTPALEVRKLVDDDSAWAFVQMKTCASFPGRRDARTVLVSLKFEPGEFVVLLGHSGSGTLLNLISGIDQPTEGTVRINGLAITELDERCTLLRRDHIGFVFQFFNLIPTHRAGECDPAAKSSLGDHPKWHSNLPSSSWNRWSRSLKYLS